MKVKWFNKNGSVQVPVKDKTTFRCIVAGSRSFNDYEFLKATLNLLLCIREQNHKIEIVSGGALGADKLGERWAKEKGHYIQRFDPDWKKFGKSAGPIRNEAMAIYADACIVFWDGKSKGTESMIRLARKYNLSLVVEPVD